MHGRLRSYDLRMPDGSRHTAVGIARVAALRSAGRGGARQGHRSQTCSARRWSFSVERHGALDDAAMDGG